MKIIIRAKEMGFCMGVERAVSIVQRLSETQIKDQVSTLGPIIHNKQVVDKFKNLGIHPIDSVDEIDCGTVVIRAHGVAPSVKKQLETKGVEVLDGTCPKVIASHKIVQKYSDLGYFIVILGDKNHGEIHGLSGYAKDFVIIENTKEAEELSISDKTLLICQTTIKNDEFNAVRNILIKKNSKIKIHNSICTATTNRQESVRVLSTKVEAIIVLGGKNSANTQRLYITATEMGVPSWHISGVEDIPEEINKFTVIGLTAGASTPEWVIQEVEKKLKEL